MSSLRSVLRDSLRSNKSSHRLRRRTQSSHFIANLLAIATLPPPTPPRERDLLSFDLWLLPSHSGHRAGISFVLSAMTGSQGFSKCQRSKSNYSWCNPPTYALMSKGVTKCLCTLWKGLIPFTKLQHRRRPMSGYIRLCKVIYGYVRLFAVMERWWSDRGMLAGDPESSPGWGGSGPQWWDYSGTGQLCIPVPVMVCGSISYDNSLGGKIVRKITLNFFLETPHLFSLP